MRRSAAVLVLGVAILAGACSSDDGGGSAANTSIPDPTTTASTTTEPRTVAPDTIPDDESQIDKAYAQGVVDEHALLAHEALKLTMAAGVVDDEVTALLQASRTETDAITASNDLFATAISGFEGLLPEPSPLTIEVLDVLVASTNCLVVEVRVDDSGVLADPPPRGEDQRDFIEFQPATSAQRESGLNPTAWARAQFPVTFDSSVPEFACE